MTKEVCKICGIVVSDLNKHLKRNRCDAVKEKRTSIRTERKNRFK